MPGRLQVTLQDVLFLPFSARYYIFLKACGRCWCPGTATCPKTIAGGKQGHASCIIILLLKHIHSFMAVKFCDVNMTVHMLLTWRDTSSSNLIYTNAQLWPAKSIFPSQTNLHTFFLSLLFPCPLLPPFLPLAFNLKIQCPSQDMTILFPQHIAMPMNTVCHSQLVYSFLQTQHEHEICASFSVFELHSTHCSHFTLSFVKFQSHFHSGTILHSHTVLLALCNSYMLSLSALEETFCHTETHRTP